MRLKLPSPGSYTLENLALKKWDARARGLILGPMSRKYARVRLGRNKYSGGGAFR